MVKTGLSEVIGSWKIIAILRAANRAHLRFRQLREIAPFEEDLAADDLRALRQQPHDRQYRRGFARARFADDSHQLAGFDGKADAIHRADLAVVGEK